MLAPRKKSYDKPRQWIKKLRHYFDDKSPYRQSFSSSHVWMWELDHKGGWALKNWCIRSAVLENTPDSPLDCKEIKAVKDKGNQPWMFTGRTDAEPEAPILWPPDTKSQLIGIDFDAGKDRRQEEKGTTEDNMVRWYHQLYGHEFEQTLRDGEGKGSLACCNPWDCKKSDTTERQNNWTTASHCKKESESSWKREKPYGCLINSTISYISQRIRSICSNKR